MPELPEVETIVRELRGSAAGKTIIGIDVLFPSSFITFPDAKDAVSKGIKIKDVVRRGKYIIFVLEGGLRLVVHLRMTGRLMWTVEDDRRKFVRLVIAFTDGTKLYFSDVRKFGRVWLFPEREFEQRTGIFKLGIEPLSADYGSFRKTVAGRRGILKNTLLRQDLLAGIGNIYADEINFRAGLHPSSRLESVSLPKIRKLYGAIRACLEEGIEHCGVSVSDFVGTRGNKGKHQHYLRVYGREGKRCRKCRDTVKRIVVAGRGTYHCPSCQPSI
jgi:formamidopyrimidine-DNA glycosylase